MSETKRKYSKVVSAESKEGLTGSYYNWILTLSCGHTATAPKWKSGWRRRTKPAPTRVVCRQCSHEVTR